VLVDGVLQEPSLGIAFAPGGHLSVLAENPSAVLLRLPAGAESGARVALIASAIACPVWIVLAETPLRRTLVGLFALGSMLIAFPLVGAARASPLFLVIAPLALLVDVLAVRYRAGLHR
jgi:hypothetical protein